MVKSVLITGGCGFIGHHVVEHLIINTDWNIIIIDKLNYASKGFDRLRDTDCLKSDRIKIYTFDLQNPISDGLKYEIGTNVNIIIHMAAETHVDNSINDPVPFIKNNVMSTVYILEFAKLCDDLEFFFYFGTDEVYGPALGDTIHSENERHNPTNPYSASKSASEQICVSYHNTYKIPLIRINVMNAFGERQYFEKFIPMVIKKVLEDEVVEIHSYPSDKQKSGSRFYIHARNIASSVLFILKNGKIGECYNVSGEKEVDNLEMAQSIADILGKELKYVMENDVENRPGHDLRYGLDGTKLKELGWEPPLNFDESLKKTVMWTMENKKWLI